MMALCVHKPSTPIVVHRAFAEVCMHAYVASPRLTRLCSLCVCLCVFESDARRVVSYMLLSEDFQVLPVPYRI